MKMLSKKFQNIESEYSVSETPVRLKTRRRLVKSYFVRETNEDQESLQNGMAVTYTNSENEELFGFLFAYKNKQNFTILPVNEECLDKIHNHNALTSLRFKNAKGVLKKSEITKKETRLWRIWCKNEYGKNSEAYEFLKVNMERAEDFIKSRNTNKLVKLPTNYKSEIVDESKNINTDAIKNITKIDEYRTRKKKNLDSIKTEYYRNKNTLEKNISTSYIDNDTEVILKNEQDGYKILEDIFYYDKTDNKIKTGHFLAKKPSLKRYTIDKGSYTNSVTQKRAVEDVLMIHVSKNPQELELFVEDLGLEKRIPEFKKDLNLKDVQDEIETEKNVEEKIDDLFESGFENNKYDSEKTYHDFKKTVKSKSDFKLFFDRSEKLLAKFKHSMLFELTLDNERESLTQIRYRLDNMKNYTKKDMKHFLNQLAKLTWVDRFNKDFKNRFEDEDLQGGISSKVRKKCARLFNKYVEGKHGADKAIDYWDNNKNWLFNQVSMIKQTMTIKKVDKKEKKSIWQRGWSKVKGWFGR